MNQLGPERSTAAPIASSVVHNQPIKTTSAELVAPDLLQEQAQQIVACLVLADYEALRGTCMDERGRLRLRNGLPPENRPSAPGGPNVYALGVAELIGFFDHSPDLAAEERLDAVNQTLKGGKIRGGGHDDCKANAAFSAWMGIIGDGGEELKDSVKRRLGDAYNEEAADYVIGKARALTQSGRYDGWNEGILGKHFGDRAGEAIEITDSAPHAGKTFVRNGVPDTTVDQTRVYGMSVVGKGSFIIDDPYLDKIEHVLTSGPDAELKKLQAEHAREFIIAALVTALPNEELYEIDILPA